MEDLRPVVVVPTYNHGSTLADVVSRTRRLDLPTIVVDDGSTDCTAEVLDRLVDPHMHVRRHEVNLGKAAALRTGFEAARRLGFTHAVTIDADGQLDPEQIPMLLAVSRSNPRDLIVGVRDASAPDYPRRSVLGRTVSNLLVFLECGFRVADSQCGFRVYPLDAVQNLPCRTGRYGYETEILTRAVWSGLQIQEAPVSCRYFSEHQRVSHLNPLRETLRAVGMHVRLLSEAQWRDRVGFAPGVLADHRFPLAVAVGVFIACQPIYGLQTIAGLLLAWLLGLNATAVLAGTLVSTPPLSFVLIGGAVAVGHVVLHGHLPTADEVSVARIGWRAVASRAGSDWLVGALVEGTCLGWVSYLISQHLTGLGTRLAARRRRNGRERDGRGGHMEEDLSQ
jgi:uncharacterized protein (DUF2062 family)